LSLLLESVILGVIQGLTEFLPISSTAHLVMVPWLFSWDVKLLNSLTYDVALHLGTFLGIVAFFWKDLVALIKAFFRSVARRNIEDEIGQRLAWCVVIGTIPAAVLGYLFEERVETTFRAPVNIAVWLVVFGIVMWVAERYSRQARQLEDIRLKDAVLIGVAQALALMPGVSRSGITISAGLFLDIKREGAARFSFLLSTPAIFGAAVVKLKVLAHGIPHGDAIPLILGTVASATSGFFAIKYLLKYLQHRKLNAFVLYRIAFAAILLLAFFARK
jgi:undecaprenyl-diphosphatase